ncbi:hypothetical protein M0R72_00005, partial [Candidatus Pacearchaeota archaeon]|nr:hypothetical protein [Candidatus Pacearchaeota archaeon]
MTNIITREFLRKNNACYDDSRIAQLVPPEGVTALQVLDADIPPADKVWVLTRRGILPDRILKLFACWCAREACRITGWDNRRSLRAIEVAEQFADGLEELKGVRQGAWAANAYSAANAYASAAYAYASAAYNAYAAAAYATAYAAAAYAAYNAAAA